MRASLIVTNLENLSTARAVLAQVRFLRRRGDDVRIYTTSLAGFSPAGSSTGGLSEMAAMAAPDLPGGDLSSLVHLVPEDLVDAESAAGLDSHLVASDLAIYHVARSHPLLNTIKTHRRGVVILCGSAGAQSDERTLLHLAPYADLVVAANPAQMALLRSVCETERLRLLPPLIDLARFEPGPVDVESAERLGLARKQVVCLAAGANQRPALRNLLQAAVASRPDALAQIATVEVGTLLPYHEAERAALYRLATLVIVPAQDENAETWMLEAMASARPVIVLGDDKSKVQGEDILSAAHVVAPEANALSNALVRVLHEDALYGELVARGQSAARTHSLERYWQALGQLLNDAAMWRPAGPTPAPASSAAPRPEPNLRATEIPPGPLADALAQVKRSANVMFNFAVRSPLPVVGPVIAWVRRTLTSHLREPYIDPTLQRQETFNWQAALALEELARRIVAQEEQLAEIAAQSKAERSHLLALVENALQSLDDPAQSAHGNVAALHANLRTQLDELRQILLRQSQVEKPEG